MLKSLIFLSLVLVGCVDGKESVQEPVSTAVSRSETQPEIQDLAFEATPVKRHGNLYFSGNPSDNAFAVAKKLGVGTVVDLKERVESKGNDVIAARRASLEYKNVPVSSREPFDKEAFEKISAIVSAAKGPVWIYCSSGNRAAAWYVSHLILKQGVDQDDAIAIGKGAGMTRPELQDRVLDYVNGPGSK